MNDNEPQPIEKNGDPGGNRTRDNLIKSHNPLFISQCLIELKTVKPLMACQWVIRKVSNLLGVYYKLLRSISMERIR